MTSAATEKLRWQQAVRVYSWNRIEGLGADEVRTVVPAFRPEWARVPLHVIGKGDAYGLQGRTRNGMFLTRSAFRVCSGSGKDRIDEPLLQRHLGSTFGQREDCLARP